jgi:pteridine reductase
MTGRKVALVTGSGKKRVGYHVARALAARDYALVIHYHRSADEAAETAEELSRGHGVPVLALQADLGNESEVKRLADSALAKFGRVDVLVNCAAIWRRKRLEEVTAADVRAHFEANTLGTFLTCRHIGLAMVAQAEGGCIVNIGDWAEVRPYADYAAYFPSKAAIPGLTRVFAVELGTRNPKVRVNALLPGPVMLPPDLPPAERAASIAATLLKREGSPEDIAKAVLLFIDSDYVTGSCLPVDGGRTVFAGGN